MARYVALTLFVLLSGGCAASRPASLPYGVDLSFLHPIDAPEPSVVQACAALPPEAREHVHVYFINGFDPLYVGNFKGLCRYVQELGFRHSYCGEMSETAPCRQAVHAVHRADPSARIVLVGYSAGANCARDVAQALKQDGIPVDLLVYIGGDTIKNAPASKPENVRRVLNVTGHGLALLGYDLVFKGCDLDGAVNQRVDARHMLLPSRKETAELLVQQLTALCRSPSVREPDWR